jgi:hypothetical protein
MIVFQWKDLKESNASEGIPALYHVRFRACQIGGPHPRFSEALPLRIRLIRACFIRLEITKW